MSIVTVEDWSPAAPAAHEAASFCRALEEGDILFFPKTPFHISDADRRFLMGVNQSGHKFHKNIAYRPRLQKITGLSRSADADRLKLKQIMQSYSGQVTEFLSSLLLPYQCRWHLDYATFRPLEEHGRDIRFTKRNDRLHVDSFPTRPTEGDRILRVFTNINPDRARTWKTGENFGELVERFAGADGLPLPKTLRPSIWSSILPKARKIAHALKLPVVERSPYDNFMLRFHHFLKDNQDYHDNGPTSTRDFPPNSSWIVYADGVAHAVLSGQYAIEQTFIVSREAMVSPEKSPIARLEKLCGGPLTTRSLAPQR